MLAYIGGEDEVTRAIAKKLVMNSCSKLSINELDFEDISSRSYGSASLKNLPSIVNLGEKAPTVFVFDSDGTCAINSLEKYCPDGWKNSFAAINVAVEEGENWLLADNKNFSKYFGINLSDIPSCNGEDEIRLPYKTSLYIMRDLAPNSKKKRVRETLKYTDRFKKPPTYNVLWPDFIYKVWNVEEAKQNSRSLSRAIERVDKVVTDYIDCF